MEYISVTDFRSNIYSAFDAIDRTGKPLLLSRKGKIYELKEKKKSARRATKKIRDLSKIIPMSCMVEDPDWYISPKLHEWSGEIDPNIR